MRLFHIAAVLVATTAAFPNPDLQVNEELFTIEVAPGETRRVTEVEKYSLINVHLLRTLQLIILYNSLTMS
jgi:hypothetical protein